MNTQIHSFSWPHSETAVVAIAVTLALAACLSGACRHHRLNRPQHPLQRSRMRYRHPPPKAVPVHSHTAP
jgi:hypothetical protein